MNGCRGGRWVLGVAHSSPALPPTVVPVRDFCSLLVVKYDTWTDH